MRILYAIKHIPTGYYLPEPTGHSGRGGSFTEPVDCSADGPNPRLFKSYLSAKRSLTQWLRGEHRGTWEYEEGYKFTTGAVVITRPERIKEDMEIVPFHLTEGE